MTLICAISGADLINISTAASRIGFCKKIKPKVGKQHLK